MPESWSSDRALQSDCYSVVHDALVERPCSRAAYHWLIPDGVVWYHRRDMFDGLSFLYNAPYWVMFDVPFLSKHGKSDPRVAVVLNVLL